jgi:aconitate hydratase
MIQDRLNIIRKLDYADKEINFFSLKALEQKGYQINHLPFCIRVLVENALRNYDGYIITQEHIETILNWKPIAQEKEIPFMPTRVLMQDFTGVPAIVDIASLREEMARKGKDPAQINPLIPIDLIIDHSVQVDYFGNNDAYRRNVDKEYERNGERYRFLKWAQTAFNNFSVVPPGMGICHQINLEYLSKCIAEKDGLAFPDSLVGTDSHTPMVNALGIVAYGVGGIEAEAAMLGQPQFFTMPEVIGLRLTGQLPVGSTATDLVLTVTELLRRTKVVGKFVEVFGEGLATLSVPDRATIANMSPEFGCTITFFPIDDKTLEYLEMTNRPEDVIRLVERYAKQNMMWRENEDAIHYTKVLELVLNTVEPSIAGPSRPQDKVLLREAKEAITTIIEKKYFRKYIQHVDRPLSRWASEGGNVEPSQVAVVEHSDMKTVGVNYNNENFDLSDGSVVIAAITSCTNTSNPDVMIGAGLLARNALQRGLMTKPWVKTSLAPGSKVVSDYLRESGLLKDLEQLNFNIVGFGCTSCIGNSGPLPDPIAETVVKHDLVVAAVLSSNRNFEARIHPQVKMNFLMSPLLVVAYAIVGRIDFDFATEPLGVGKDNEPVFLRDLWPGEKEVRDQVNKFVRREFFQKNYDEIFEGNEQWKNLVAPTAKAYQWDPKSTYVKEPPFFVGISENAPAIAPIENAAVLAVFGDSITTDHISPAGTISVDSPAGKYLIERGVPPEEFNSYGSRRGSDEVMIRGTFANVRLINKLTAKEGGFTKYLSTGEDISIFEASQRYQRANIPLLIFAGKEYGSGSSRDWAAKGTSLLGVKAVVAESFERIHRSNLVGMGVLPLQFIIGENADTIGLDGTESFTIRDLNESIRPGQKLTIVAQHPDGTKKEFDLISRLDSKIEIDYYRNGGILHYILRRFLKSGIA